MRIYRFFPRFFSAKIYDEEITQKHEKTFDEILQEEHTRLIKLISEAIENADIKQLYQKYNPRMIDYMFPDE
ncbi:MAG: hypothetical protein SCARUB_01299 [Candidatus Scalindua rubra]|uniref:Uncharacterized protein n=1 Tax=Candidatus Scalindua rubra TaxID=1872076 RepID=A0A1E3XD53_9BACT|nr:MAG: hypothetical protein SCARUB_01299 [Candidatus Scalindua rubra]